MGVIDDGDEESGPPIRAYQQVSKQWMAGHSARGTRLPGLLLTETGVRLTELSEIARHDRKVDTTLAAAQELTQAFFELCYIASHFDLDLELVISEEWQDRFPEALGL